MEELNIDAFLIRKCSIVLKALKHPLRSQMLKLIHERQPITVTEIYTRLGIEQSIASIHLSVLRQARFVSTERKGKQIFYSINYERFDDVNKLLAQLQ
jgi:DNA-binding transcriptional ArsR family regulator